MRQYWLVILVFFTLLHSQSANAENIRWVTEYWYNYTNKDGTGLYNDIVKEVFAEHDLETIYIPWKRALLEVKNGKADMTGATSSVKGYATPRASILTAPISILFNKKHMVYKDSSSLTNHTGVWPSPYEDELFLNTEKAHFNGFSVQERETAYKLLMSGRADYFLDTRALHQAWLASQELKTKGKIIANDYEIVDISYLDLYIVFTDNERGRRLKDIFDAGVERLRQQGKLRKIYEKYNFLEQMPSR